MTQPNFHFITKRINWSLVVDGNEILPVSFEGTHLTSTFCWYMILGEIMVKKN